MRALSGATFALPLVIYTAVYFIDGSAFHPSGDGYYSWIFARSLAFDGDLDLRNDYELCGDPFGVGMDRGTGHLDDPFYPGPAVFWVVPLALLRALFTLSLGTAHAASASCGGWMTALTILAGPACGSLSVWFSYKASRLLVAPEVAAFTALLFAFTSPLFPYSTSVAHYSHIYLTCIVAGLTYVSLRIIVEGQRLRDWLWIASLIAVAILHRAPATLYALIAASTLVRLACGPRPRYWWRTVVGIAAGTTVGLALTSALYMYLYGKWVALPQGPDYVHLAHAHPWLLLFGVHGGFFFWMPAAWLAVPGIVVVVYRRGRTRWFALCCLGASTCELVISSAPLDWHGNWSLGARRLLPLTPFVVVFSSLALDHVYERLRPAWRLSRRTKPLVACILVLVVVNNIAASTTIRGDKELSQRELYGSWSPFRPIWTLLDALGLDVALLPAEAYFALIYRLPTRSYRAVLKPRYRRGYRDLAFSDTEIDLRDPTTASLQSGTRSSDRGMEVGTKEGHLVFAAEWPFATHVRVLVSGEEGVRLTIGIHRPFRTSVQVGTVTLPASNGESSTWFELALPPEAFDSGIIDWTFSTNEGSARVAIFAIEDRTPRVPHGCLSAVPSWITAQVE